MILAPLFLYPLPSALSLKARGLPRSPAPPVSYTHLDVYKRQSLRELTARIRAVLRRAEKSTTATSALLRVCLLYTSRCV